MYKAPNKLYKVKKVSIKKLNLYLHKIKKMKLFLDDERKPIDAYYYTKKSIYQEGYWDVVKNFDEFKNYILNNEIPEIISLDHDLTNDHYRYAFAKYIPYDEVRGKTGYHCLLWLILYCENNGIEMPEILIHTMNVEGQNNMNNLIHAYEYLKK